MYWFDTVETIPDGVGFPYYGFVHFLWLGAFVLVAAVLSLLYRRSDIKMRRVIRIIIGSLIVFDEIFKWVSLFAGGNVNASYLPFHLCSINIFLVAIHMFKPLKLFDNFLYLICIPAAIIALLFPTWVALPPVNFMHIHSFTVHILLAVYPIMLTVGGDIKPTVKRLPSCLLLLTGMAAVAYTINVLLDTNFMFLMYAEAGNPLLWFEENWGNHLLGILVILPSVIAVMYGIVYVARACGKNFKPKEK